MNDTGSTCGWVTIEEAARELETTPIRVLMLVKDGLLQGRERNGAWEVNRRSLDGVKEHSFEKTPRHKHTCGGCSACS